MASSGPILFEGWLHKSDPGGKSWKPRFCVLLPDLFVYFSDELKQTPKGVFELAGCELVPPKEGSIRAPPTPFLFALRVPAGRQYSFATDSGEALEDWCAAVSAALNGEQPQSFGQQLQEQQQDEPLMQWQQQQQQEQQFAQQQQQQQQQFSQAQEAQAQQSQSAGQSLSELAAYESELHAQAQGQAEFGQQLAARHAELAAIEQRAEVAKAEHDERLSHLLLAQEQLQAQHAALANHVGLPSLPSSPLQITAASSGGGGAYAADPFSDALGARTWLAHALQVPGVGRIDAAGRVLPASPKIATASAMSASTAPLSGAPATSGEQPEPTVVVTVLVCLPDGSPHQPYTLVLPAKRAGAISMGRLKRNLAKSLPPSLMLTPAAGARPGAPRPEARLRLSVDPSPGQPGLADIPDEWLGSDIGICDGAVLRLTVLNAASSSSSSSSTSLSVAAPSFSSPSVDTPLPTASTRATIFPSLAAAPGASAPAPAPPPPPPAGQSRRIRSATAAAAAAATGLVEEQHLLAGPDAGHAAAVDDAVAVGGPHLAVGGIVGEGSSSVMGSLHPGAPSAQQLAESAAAAAAVAAAERAAEAASAAVLSSRLNKRLRLRSLFMSIATNPLGGFGSPQAPSSLASPAGRASPGGGAHSPGGDLADASSSPLVDRSDLAAALAGEPDIAVWPEFSALLLRVLSPPPRSSSAPSPRADVSESGSHRISWPTLATLLNELSTTAAADAAAAAAPPRISPSVARGGSFVPPSFTTPGRVSPPHPIAAARNKSSTSPLPQPSLQPPHAIAAEGRRASFSTAAGGVSAPQTVPLPKRARDILSRLPPAIVTPEELSSGGGGGGGGGEEGEEGEGGTDLGVEIETPDGVIASIPMRVGDDPNAVALAFVASHGLPHSDVSDVLSLLTPRLLSATQGELVRTRTALQDVADALDTANVRILAATAAAATSAAMAAAATAAAAAAAAAPPPPLRTVSSPSRLASRRDSLTDADVSLLSPRERARREDAAADLARLDQLMHALHDAEAAEAAAATATRERDEALAALEAAREEVSADRAALAHERAALYRSADEARLAVTAATRAMEDASARADAACVREEEAKRELKEHVEEEAKRRTAWSFVDPIGYGVSASNSAAAAAAAAAAWGTSSESSSLSVSRLQQLQQLSGSSTAAALSEKQALLMRANADRTALVEENKRLRSALAISRSDVRLGGSSGTRASSAVGGSGGTAASAALNLEAEFRSRAADEQSAQLQAELTALACARARAESDARMIARKAEADKKDWEVERSHLQRQLQGLLLTGAHAAGAAGAAARPPPIPAFYPRSSAT